MPTMYMTPALGSMTGVLMMPTASPGTESHDGIDDAGKGLSM